MSEEFSLKESLKNLGQLCPVIKDKFGNVVDGFHRLNEDKNCFSVTNEKIDDAIKLELARLAINFVRRKVPETELRERIGFLVKQGLKVDEIAEKSGISRATVYRYMPQELKSESSEAISEGRKRQVSLATSCDNCKVNVSQEDLKAWNGNKLCGRCYAQALDHPAQFHQRLDGKTVEMPKRKPKDEDLTNLISCDFCGRPIGIMNAKNLDGKDLCPSCYDKSVNSKGERQARMQPGISKMDQEMLVRLQNNQVLRQNGWKVEFQKPYHITTLISDVTLVKDNREIVLFFDGPVHLNKQDRDEYNRSKLESRFPNTKTLSLPYKAATEKEFERLEETVVKEVA